MVMNYWGSLVVRQDHGYVRSRIISLAWSLMVYSRPVIRKRRQELPGRSWRMKKPDDRTTREKDTKMAKVNKQGPQKKEANANIPKTTETKKPATGAVQNSRFNTPKDTASTGKPGGKSNRSRVGGTAVPGAKSTQPKEVSSTNPQ